MRDRKWSPTEKATARRVFDEALSRELDAIITETQNRAARIKEPADLWKLENWLSDRRRDVENKYDFRYSVLPIVFIRLLHAGIINREDLSGLNPDKVAFIERGASIADL